MNMTVADHNDHIARSRATTERSRAAIRLLSEAAQAISDDELALARKLQRRAGLLLLGLVDA